MIYREEHINNFTKIDNNILKDKELSLAAKGLLITMLSLPDNWNYSTLGLSYLTKESKNTIHRLLKELECKNYLIRKSIRDEKGRFVKFDYIVYEIPYLKIRDMELPDMEINDDNKLLNNQDKIDKTSLNEITKEIIKRGYITEKNVNVVLIDNYLNNLLYRYNYNDVIKVSIYVMKHLNDSNYKDEEGKEIVNITSYVITSIEDNLSKQDISFDDWYE